MAFATIDKPSKYFNTLTWTGDNTNRTLTGVGFQPDWVWWKQRNGTDDHRLIDSVRGEGTASYKILFSDTTDAEYNGNDNGGSQGNINALNSDGFSGSQGSTGWNNWNGSGYNYVAWNWLASNTTVSNTAGSITSTVSANTTSGFSIVSFTSQSSGSATIGHGLGVAPKFIITKLRDSADNWRVYHSSLGNTNHLRLNLTDAVQSAPNSWNSTSPTSTVFTLGTTFAGSYNMIAYCFAEVKGFSKAFSYVGNGSSDGTYVHLGFRPAFVMLKSSSSASGNWLIQDNKRLGYNASNSELFANLSNAEGTYDRADFLSNGFKARINSGENNSSGVTYIGFAVAESPFVSSKGVPVCAR